MIFTLDTVAQQNDSIRPYLRLWAEVMRCGVTDFCTARARGSSANHPATKWLWSDEVHTGSFVWLCHLFDLDPASARSQVLKKWRQHVEKRMAFNTRGKHHE